VASLVGGCFVTPYLAEPTAPWAALIRLVLVVPPTFGLTLWAAHEFLPGVRLWGSGQRALTRARALLLSASFAAIFWLPDAGLAWGGAAYRHLRQVW
jgi:hypothetical protein